MKLLKIKYWHESVIPKMYKKETETPIIDLTNINNENGFFLEDGKTFIKLESVISAEVIL